MKIKKTLCIILALLLILGLTPGSAYAKKFTTGKDEPYVYTAEDRAELDRQIFSRISDVVETARKRIGPADELNDGKDRSRTVLTEEDYIALIPEVIERYLILEMMPYVRGKKDWDDCYKRFLNTLELYASE